MQRCISTKGKLNFCYTEVYEVMMRNAGKFFKYFQYILQKFRRKVIFTDFVELKHISRGMTVRLNFSLFYRKYVELLPNQRHA